MGVGATQGVITAMHVCGGAGIARLSDFARMTGDAVDARDARCCFLSPSPRVGAPPLLASISHTPDDLPPALFPLTVSIITNSNRHCPATPCFESTARRGRPIPIT